MRIKITETIKTSEYSRDEYTLYQLYVGDTCILGSGEPITRDRAQRAVAQHVRALALDKAKLINNQG